MGERADGLRGVSRQNASGSLMTKRADSLASASRVRYTSRRASLYRLNCDVFARLDKIATPSKVLSQLAWRAAPPPVGACPQRLAGPVLVGSGSVPMGRTDGLRRPHRTIYRSFASPRRGLSPWEGARPHAPRFAPSCVAVPIGFRPHQVFRRHLLHFGIEAKEVWSWNRKYGIVKYGELE